VEFINSFYADSEGIFKANPEYFSKRNSAGIVINPDGFRGRPFEYVATSRPKILLIGDGMMKPHLVQRAKAEGISNVVFLDPVTKTRLAGLMQSADLGLMTLQNVPAFYRGTSPNKFFDFIAAGKPVLNNYPGWLADMISTHRCGLVVPPDDPEAFADALEYASANRDEVSRMGRAARQLAREEFDRDLLANRFCSLLESVGTAARRTGQ